MKAYNLVLSCVFQAKMFIFVFYAIIYGGCAAILNHMVDIAHFLLGPHIRSFWWWKIARHFDVADFGQLLQLTYKKNVVAGLCITLCCMPWHGHSNSVTQTEALKKLLHLGAMFGMPSSLPLLHTAMPTPCLNTCRIAIPTYFGNVFCLKLFLWIFFLSLIFSEAKQLHVAAATG